MSANEKRRVASAPLVKNVISKFRDRRYTLQELPALDPWQTLVDGWSKPPVTAEAPVLATPVAQPKSDSPPARLGASH
jgi:hypothetical protein